ncbi:GATA-4/5/6 transcription factor [Handroanthus impetiginosus]|uniref:GATA transcription factor n=1 Tax=Handroanthus impetiginosus TaxID=429701 RepID=A0A2G9GRK7_9LAMI|nr:GATA-4/5/6 transcription factor [Handroanthus impetiginosus]
MECIEARALKSSFLSQMAMKTNSQVFYNDDGWCLTGINTVGCDDFPVEDLLNLDFPEKEFQDGCFLQEDEGSLKGSSINSSSSSIFSGADDFDSLSAGELGVPVDDLENLEWLSQFVDDSTTTGLSLLCPAGSVPAKFGGNSGNRVEPVKRPPQKIRASSFPVPVTRKPRSKSLRSKGRPWSLASPPLSAVMDSSSTPSSSYGSSPLSPLVFLNPVHDTEWFSSVEKPPAKKQKRKPEAETGSISGRRCTHCHVQKTPQWRTGPLGPKTLCNACGVRFKSGRLFPEYRPACSPTFSQEMHSNSHRKVLEMRRKKEMAGLVEPESGESGLPEAVQSL